MTIKTSKKITSWSYSRFSQYVKCPFAAKCKFIDKLPEPPSPAMQRGDTIHKLAEAYTKGAVKKLPAELEKFKTEFTELRTSNPIVEQTWAFTRDWMETAWNNWSECWVRIKTDAACLDETDLYVIDHKTGKKRDGYKEQMSLYGLAGMLKFPHVKRVITKLWFLDSGEEVEEVFEAKERKKLQVGWTKKVQPMMNDSEFKPRPGEHCRFCAFSKSKGGPCKY